MLLKGNKIAASSLAEVVIALAVIALCFGAASLIFTRSILVTTSFDEVRSQTEIQSHIWDQLRNGTSEFEVEGLSFETEADELNDSLVVETWTGVHERVIWKQQGLKHGH